MTSITPNTDYGSGSYDQDLLNILMQEENAQLANPNSSQTVINFYLRPQYDGGKSIAIGYGLDLLYNSISDINKYLAAANLALTSGDINLINQAKANPSPANLKLTKGVTHKPAWVKRVNESMAA